MLLRRYRLAGLLHNALAERDRQFIERLRTPNPSTAL